MQSIPPIPNIMLKLEKKLQKNTMDVFEGKTTEETGLTFLA